jgi:hypothetical protein
LLELSGASTRILDVSFPTRKVTSWWPYSCCGCWRGLRARRRKLLTEWSRRNCYQPQYCHIAAGDKTCTGCPVQENRRLEGHADLLRRYRYPWPGSPWWRRPSSTWPYPSTGKHNFPAALGNTPAPNSHAVISTRWSRDSIAYSSMSRATWGSEFPCLGRQSSTPVDSHDQRCEGCISKCCVRT